MSNRFTMGGAVGDHPLGMGGRCIAEVTGNALVGNVMIRGGGQSVTIPAGAAVGVRSGLEVQAHKGTQFIVNFSNAADRLIVEGEFSRAA